MAKAKRGQKVRHNSSGREGVISSVFRGMAHVIFRDGSHSYVHTGQLSKSGGCLLILAIPAIVFLIGVISFGSQAA